VRWPLASLRDVLTVTSGQKVAYVTDAADTAAKLGSYYSARPQCGPVVHRGPFCGSRQGAGGGSHLSDDNCRHHLVHESRFVPT
jgi:hypothetical protein